MSYDLSGKVYVVTGSSTGIGRSIAINLAKHGANVVLHGRKPSDSLSEVASQIQTYGSESHQLYADFSELSALAPLVDSAWDWKGRIDGWINNAGGDVLTGNWKDRPFDEKLDYLLKTDVSATLMLCRSVGKKMFDRFENLSVDSASAASSPLDSSSTESSTGVIINIGWDQAWQGMEGDSGELFATTKGAIMAMTKSLAQTFAPHVRVNCIAPGWIETKWGQQTSAYWDQRAKSESLMNRWGSPADVASTALFLCSPAASFISGHILPVNGGFRYSANHSRDITNDPY